MSDRSNHVFGEPVLHFGTPEQAREWVGHTSGRLVCDAEVNGSQIRSFCALVRDGNPSYWDREWATSAHGSLLAPPATLMVWSMPLPWMPGDAPVRGPVFAAAVPLPGDTLINVSTETRFYQPMRVGDQLSFEDEVVAVSSEKQTRLGTGHFVTTRATYWNQRDERIASHDNVLFRFSAAGRPDSQTADQSDAQSDAQSAAQTAAQASASQDRAGDAEAANTEAIAPIVMPVTLTLCVLDASATRDFFPGHHDREYARAQNARDVYLNTMFFHGLADRLALDWAGPRARIERRTLHMLSPVCVGDTLTATGVVEREDDDRAIIAVDMRTRSAPGARARVTVVQSGAG